MSKELVKRKDVSAGAAAKEAAPKRAGAAKAGLRSLGFEAAAEKLRPAKDTQKPKSDQAGPESVAKGETSAPIGAATEGKGSPQESGSFVVSGAWDSFGEWYLTFHGGALVDSHTDDLSSGEWPTTLTRDGNEIVLSAVQQGGDATITEELRVVFVDGQLVAKAAKTTFVDLTDDSVTVKSVGVSASRA